MNPAERNLTTRLTNNTMLRELLYQGKLKPQTFWGFDLLDYVPKVEIVHSEGICPPSKNRDELGIFDLLGYYDTTCQTVNICEQQIAEHLKREGSQNSTTGYLAIREVIRLHEHAHAIIDTCGFNGFSAPSHEWFVSLPNDVGEPLAQFIVWSLLNGKDGEKLLLMEAFKKLCKNQPQIYGNWDKIKNCFDRVLGDPLAKAMIKAINYQPLIPSIVKFSRTKGWTSFDKFKGELSKLDPNEIIGQIMESYAFLIRDEAQLKAGEIRFFMRNEKSLTQEKDEKVD